MAIFVIIEARSPACDFDDFVVTHPLPPEELEDSSGDFARLDWRVVADPYAFDGFFMHPIEPLPKPDSDRHD